MKTIYTCSQWNPSFQQMETISKPQKNHIQRHWKPQNRYPLMRKCIHLQVDTVTVSTLLCTTTCFFFLLSSLTDGWTDRWTYRHCCTKIPSIQRWAYKNRMFKFWMHKFVYHTNINLFWDNKWRVWSTNL